MPAIRQIVLRPDGFRIEAAGLGLMELFAEDLGTSIHLRVTRNGIVEAETTMVNPSVAEVEAWVTEALGGELSIKNGTLTLWLWYFAWHIRTLKPLNFDLMASDRPIPANWWQVPQ